MSNQYFYARTFKVGKVKLSQLSHTCVFLSSVFQLLLEHKNFGELPIIVAIFFLGISVIQYL